VGIIWFFEDLFGMIGGLFVGFFNFVLAMIGVYF